MTDLLGHSLAGLQKGSKNMEATLCICGKSFKRVVDGRCPHCGIRIMTGKEDMFAAFMASEVEETYWLSKSTDGKRHVEQYYRDMNTKGPQRHGWHRWPSSLTKSQIKALEAVQNMTS
ncbi:MAG: hypothetical protein ACOYYS_19195 [Chloroflexota bacterium]